MHWHQIRLSILNNTYNMVNLYTLFLTAIFSSSTPNSEINSCNFTKTILNYQPVYVSEWESNNTWLENKGPSDKVFYTERQFPQLSKSVLENSVVLVFTKGYEFMVSNQKSKPLPLPCMLFTASDDLSQPCKWNVNKKSGMIEIGLILPSLLENTFQQNQSELAFRYFIIQENFLKQHKLSRSAIQNMSYQQVIQIVNVTP
jgi:hypothetical protein